MQVPAERAVDLVYIILVSGELDWQCHWARWTLVFSVRALCAIISQSLAHDPNSGGT